MSDRSYTKEQAVIVERILKNGATDYYKILEVEKSSSEAEIKKAYRKLSLKVHPDKNAHPKADESFKRVNKAFEVLGDAQQRTIYDQTGGEPPRGMGTGSSAGGQGFPQGFGGAGGMPQGFQGFQFANDDLFDMLFGGQTGGQGFSFGGPGGFTMYTSGGGGGPGGFPGFASGGGFPGFGDQRQQQRRQRQQERQQPQDTSILGQLRQYLPLLLLLIMPLLSNIFAETPEKFSMQATPSFSHQRISERYQVPYYIKQEQAARLSPKVLRQLDVSAEDNYITDLRGECKRERDYKEMKVQNAYGWFFPDEEKMAKAQAIRLPHCERLAQLGQGLL